MIKDRKLCCEGLEIVNILKEKAAKSEQKWKVEVKSRIIADFGQWLRHYGKAAGARLWSAAQSTGCAALHFFSGGHGTVDAPPPS